ncbi:SUKH-4 family immunity protein [Streptomyces sp. F63]|nr:SUKH-4 family immunity protein [Streptomyces sp. F63]
MSLTAAHDRLVEVFGADGVVRAPDAPVLHEESRRWLAEVGVPRQAGSMRLDPDPPGGLRTVASHFTPGAELPPGVAEMLVIGEVVDPEEQGAVAYDPDTAQRKVLLDPVSGRVHLVCFFVEENSAGLLELLAPGLSMLVALSSDVEELRTERGEFARFAGRFGPEVVAELTRLMLDRVRSRGPELLRCVRDVSRLWHIEARIRPLAKIAGPGEGLLLDLPDGFLAGAFGADDVVCFPDEDVPAVLTHEPTRRFLREQGLPRDAGWFTARDEERPLRSLWDHWFADDDADPDEAPANVHELVVLGYLIDDIDLVVEGPTGRILGWYGPEATLRVVNTDVSGLAFTTWLWHQEQALDRDERLTDSYEELATTMTEVLARVDPAACEPTGAEDDFRYWSEVFADEGGGGLSAG